MNKNKLTRIFLQTTGIISFTIGFAFMVASLQFDIPPLLVLLVFPTMIYGIAAPIFSSLYPDEAQTNNT